MSLKKTIRKFALQNASRYNGKANIGAVIGKVLGEFPDYKDKTKELSKEISEIIKEVNAMSVEAQTEELKKIAPEMLEKKDTRREGLRELNNAVKGKVVMRFEPSPSGPLHIGHSYPLMLNVEYCSTYGGKLILRIADTNPDNIHAPAYKLLEEDTSWLSENTKLITVVQSDRMEIYYKYALQLLEEGNAYVCACSAEEFKKSADEMVACPCRDNSSDRNVKLWHSMLKDMEQGGAVVRIKTNIKHKNPAMRDFPIFRINESEHPRQGRKYRVWPLMNFVVAVDDHDLGLTHVLRGKDHYDNTKRQMFIFDYLKWKAPEYIHIGRINFEGLRLKSTETRQKIDEGVYSGWDDIQLPFIQALKRRGYQPGAFRKFAVSTGVTMVDKKVDGKEFFKMVDFFNREIIEEKSDRYFFVENPKEILIENAPNQDIELDLHPDHRKKGRKFSTNQKFLVAEGDLKNMKDGNLYRLMDCVNFTKNKSKFVFDSTDYMKYKEKGQMIIHWLPAEDDSATVEVMMPDNTMKIGLGESTMKNLEVGDIIQMERFGFARLDSKEDDKLVFWFTHK